jgi:hypothetical protein
LTTLLSGPVEAMFRSPNASAPEVTSVQPPWIRALTASVAVSWPLRATDAANRHHGGNDSLTANFDMRRSFDELLFAKDVHPQPHDGVTVEPDTT